MDAPLPPLPLCGGLLNRAEDRREDLEWLRAQLQGAQFLVISEDLSALSVADRNSPLALDARQIAERAPADLDDLILLGLDSRGGAVFARSVADPAGLERPGEAWVGLREAATRWSREDAARFAQAAALVAWHRRHRYCGECGASLRSTRAGHALVCSAGNSCREVFPRLDPAIIVLVEDADRCLLGRQSSWPAGTYSTLAGFVEPGESLEEAVAREVHEESGVRVDACRYRGSQPWPFPSSLMIGFRAVATDPTLRLGDELEDARWFSVDDLLSGVRAGAFRPPARISIARALLLDWVSGQQGASARELEALLRE